MVAQIDDESIQGIGGVHSGHGSFEDGEPSNVETFDRYVRRKSGANQGR